jgi:hypothetical protein
VERDAVLFHFDALEKKYKKFCHVKQRKKKKKKFSFFFFLRNQQKIPLRHELFYHTDREKRTYHGGGGGRDFSSHDGRRTGRPSWTREESYSFGDAQTKMPKSQAKRERKNI